MKWNKFRLKTTTEAEDIVSSMLADLGIEGVEIEDKIPLTESDKEQMFVDILPEIEADDGVAYLSFYLEEDEDKEKVLANVKKELEEMSAYVNVGACEIEESQTEDVDWVNNWKKYFHQFYVDDILIIPSWEDVKPSDEDKMVIHIDPGTAFGTGMHETTQLCIRQIRKYTTETTKILDVGCGSGILGLAAFLAMLGTSIWALVKSRKEKPLIVMLLGACVLQMFGQAVSDVTWSVGCCVPTFFAVLALVTLHCGDSLRLNVPNKSKGGAVRWPITAVSAVFIVLIGLNLIAQSKFSSDELTLDDLKQCASIDLFETNDYKLSYLISGGNEEGVADRYAADLSRVDSNAIAIPLAQYYAGVGDYTKALDALDRGAKYTRANAEVWQKMFSLYEQMIDPVGGSIGAAQWLQDDTYLNRMVKGYETLCQVNADQLDDVLLTAENNAFLNKLLAADALDPYDFVDALTIFSSLGLDTAYLPDADGNGVPDCAEVQEGSVTWNGGAFTADSDSTVVFSTVLKNEGSYELAVESSGLGGVAEADVDGAAVTLDASGKAVIEADRLGDSDEPVTIALHVRAGTTVSHVTWNKQ